MLYQCCYFSIRYSIIGYIYSSAIRFPYYTSFIFAVSLTNIPSFTLRNATHSRIHSRYRHYIEPYSRTGFPFQNKNMRYVICRTINGKYILQICESKRHPLTLKSVTKSQSERQFTQRKFAKGFFFSGATKRAIFHTERCRFCIDGKLNSPV